MKPEDLIKKFRQEAVRCERNFATFAHLQPVALTFIQAHQIFRQAADDLEETIARPVVAAQREA